MALVAAATATHEANVAFLGWLDGDLVTITITWYGIDGTPPRGRWGEYSIERTPLDPSDDEIRDAMLRGRPIPKPRKAREPSVDPADVSADVKAFETAVEEIGRR